MSRSDGMDQASSDTILMPKELCLHDLLLLQKRMSRVHNSHIKFTHLFVLLFFFLQKILLIFT